MVSNLIYRREYKMQICYVNVCIVYCIIYEFSSKIPNKITSFRIFHSSHLKLPNRLRKEKYISIIGRFALINIENTYSMLV